MPTVWIVDDLPANLQGFVNAHGNQFTIRTFESPSQVLTALQTESPDVLLCDIYFFDSREEAETAEAEVHRRTEELRDLADRFRLHQAGITLIETISRQYDSRPPFLLYAYTSKGPYLLQGEGFDRISKAGAKWLFKGRFNRETEELIIRNELEEYQVVHGWKHQFGLIKKFVIWTGIISAILSTLFGYLLHRWNLM